MRSYLAFWGSCLNWSFFRWGRGEPVLGNLPPLMAAWAAAVLPSGAGIWLTQRTGDLLWLFLFAPLVIMVVLLAPYRLWREQQDRASVAEAKLIPNIAVAADVVSGLNLGQGPRDKTAVVTVAGRGGERIGSATGFLHGVYTETDGRLDRVDSISTVYLQWSARHGSRDAREHTFGSEGAHLDVVRMIKPYNGKCVVIAFDSQLWRDFRLDERETYILDIEISADNSSSVRRGYRLTTNPLGNFAEKDAYGDFDVEKPLPDWAFEVLDARWDEVIRST